MRLPFKKKWLVLVIVLVIVAVGWIIKSRSVPDGKPVDMAKVSNQIIRPVILSSGTLAYRTEVQLTAEVTAKVKALLVKEGDDVEKGQVLLRLDPQSYRNAIEREEAARRQNVVSIERQRVALELRRKQFERTKRLFDAKMIDNNKFDEDRNQMQLAEVELRSSEEALKRQDVILKDAREQLGKTDIVAPMTGRVVAIPIKVGETAIPSTMSLAGAQLMTLVDTSALLAELKVDEGDIARIVVGQSVDIFAAAWPERSLQGTVEKMALTPTIENQARAYKVTVKIAPSKDMILRSGMSCRAEIKLGDATPRIAVPVEAILTEDGENRQVKRFAYVVRAGVVKKTPVDIGISDDRWQEVIKGLNTGDEIVTGPGKNLHELKDGDKVFPAPKVPAPPHAAGKPA